MEIVFQQFRELKYEYMNVMLQGNGWKQQDIEPHSENSWFRLIELKCMNIYIAWGTSQLLHQGTVISYYFV